MRDEQKKKREWQEYISIYWLKQIKNHKKKQNAIITFQMKKWLLSHKNACFFDCVANFLVDYTHTYIYKNSHLPLHFITHSHQIQTMKITVWIIRKSIIRHMQSLYPFYNSIFIKSFVDLHLSKIFIRFKILITVSI